MVCLGWGSSVGWDSDGCWFESRGQQNDPPIGALSKGLNPNCSMAAPTVPSKPFS